MKKGANGSGTIRKKTVIRNGKEYNYWEARYTAGRHPGTGKQIQKSVTGKTQKEVAQKLRDALKNSKNAASADMSQLTLAQWLEIWIREYKQQSTKQTTLRTYNSVIQNQINPELGATKLNKLTTHHIQVAINNINRSGLSSTSTRLCGAIITAALHQAEINGILEKSPAHDIQYPKLEKAEIKPLTREQTAAFLKEINGDKYERVFKVLLFTGMRISELAGLTWECVDLKNGIITIDKQIQQVKGENIWQSPKSGKPREIAVAQYVVDVLKEQRASQRPNTLKFDGRNLVFQSDLGNPLHLPTLRKRIKAIGNQIGCPNIRLHDLRHSFAVASLTAGDDIKTVQQNLGHATASFTLDQYIHVTDEMKRDSANRMDEYIKAVK